MLSVRERGICPHCYETVEGAVCRSCGSVLGEDMRNVPAPQPMRPRESSRCPYCAAGIRSDAAVCHSCGSLLIRNG
jgi:predicted amidophosphoribosyltransferase